MRIGFPQSDVYYTCCLGDQLLLVSRDPIYSRENQQFSCYRSPLGLPK